MKAASEVPSAADTAQPGEFREGWPIVVSALIGIALGLGTVPFYTQSIMAPELVAAFGWSYAQVMSGLSVMTIVIVATSPLAGYLADRWGVREVALVSTFLFSITFMGFAFMNGEFWVYLGLWALIAVAGAGTLPGVWTQGVASVFRDHRGLALGISLTGGGIFAVVAKPICAATIESFGWRGAYLALGILPLVIAIPVAAKLFRPRIAARPATGRKRAVDLLGAVRSRRFWTLFLAFVLIAFAIGSPIVHMQNILAVAQLGEDDAYLILPAIGLGVIFGRLVCGQLFDMFWAPAVGALLLLMPAAGCLILTLPTPGFTAALLAVVCLALAAGMEVDLMGYLISRYFGLAGYGGIFGAIYVAFAIGSGVGPIFYGNRFDTTGSYNDALMASCACLIGGAALLLTLGRYQPREAISLQAEATAEPI